MEADPKTFGLDDLFEFIPVEGRPNISIMRAKKLPPPDRKMPEVDWDQFEKDINDSCEQIP